MPRFGLTAKIEGRFADGRSLTTLPSEFELDKGYTDECVIRARRRVKWYCRHSSNDKKIAPPPGSQPITASCVNTLYISQLLPIFGM
jgi:hypothetical protein